MNKKINAVALLTLAAVTFLGIKDLRAELVFEDELEPAAAVEQKVSGEDAELKQREVEMSRSERLRRHRIRAEMRNEDKLSEKLEELRLKDELKRMDALSGVNKEEQKPAEPVIEQQIGTLAAAPSATIAVPASNAPVAPAPAVAPQSVAEVKEEKKEDEDKMRVGITPRGGLAGIINSNFEVSSRYSFGVGVYVDVMNHLGFEAGYTRAQYSMAAGTAYGNVYYGYTQQQLLMSQNVFDIGPRINILGRKSRVQPFVGVGVGYYRNSINLDQNTLNFVRMYNPAMASDFTVSGMLGYIGGGAEIKITDNIGLMGLFRYYNVLTARQSNPLSSAAFVSSNNPNAPSASSTYGVYSGVPGGDPRFNASQNFGKADFYTLQGGLTVSF